jgi:hypothetical protein
MEPVTLDDVMAELRILRLMVAETLTLMVELHSVKEPIAQAMAALEDSPIFHMLNRGKKK